MRHFWKQLAYAAIAKLIVAERYRIIELLESNASPFKKVILTPELISEIKGEQK